MNEYLIKSLLVIFLFYSSYSYSQTSDSLDVKTINTIIKLEEEVATLNNSIKNVEMGLYQFYNDNRRGNTLIMVGIGVNIIGGFCILKSPSANGISMQDKDNLAKFGTGCLCVGGVLSFVGILWKFFSINKLKPNRIYVNEYGVSYRIPLNK
jgi:hypothetical protein